MSLQRIESVFRRLDLPRHNLLRAKPHGGQAALTWPRHWPSSRATRHTDGKGKAAWMSWSATCWRFPYRGVPPGNFRHAAHVSMGGGLVHTSSLGLCWLQQSLQIVAEISRKIPAHICRSPKYHPSTCNGTCGRPHAAGLCAKPSLCGPKPCPP